MKQKENKITRTFATEPTLWDRAKKKAQREGTTISEKIDGWLRGYVKPAKAPLSDLAEGQGIQ